MPVNFSEEEAARFDAADPLASFRERFCMPRAEDGSEMLYLCGHSLGLRPKSTQKYVDDELEAWKSLGVQGQFRLGEPWVNYPERLAAPMARIVGAEPPEVTLMGSLSVNLHVAMASFYRPAAHRYRILIECHAFPSDRYAIESQIRWHGLDPADAVVTLKPRSGESALRTEDIENVIRREGDSIALILLGGVQYFTGQFFDIERITAVGHAKGCKVGFDLAHAVGNVPLRLHDHGVDFAVWCTYKYLNSGPGGVGGLFVHKDRWSSDPPMLAGWWGHNPETRFNMPDHFEADEGAAGWQISNPPILQMAALRASLMIFDEAGMEAIRAKSVRLLGYLDSLLHELPPAGFSIVTPSDPASRGAQVSLSVRAGREAMFEMLRENNVVCDHRGPLIRVSFVPFYNSFRDVCRFAGILARSM
jgi:kynureninase